MISDNGKLAVLGKRKHSAAVSQKYHGFLRSLDGSLVVFIAAKQLFRIFVKRGALVEFTQHETCFQRTEKRPVNVCGRNKLPVKRFTRRSTDYILVIGHDVRAVMGVDLGKRGGMVGVAAVVLHILNEVCAVGDRKQQSPLIAAELL